MKTTPCARQFEFYNQQPENFLLVRSEGEEVTVYAAFDNFSERRKSMFIRELAAEGFIPERRGWSSSMGSAMGDVRWVIDSSWVKVNGRLMRQTDRLWSKILLVGTMVLLGWLAVIFSGTFNGTGAPARGNTRTGRIILQQKTKPAANAKEHALHSGESAVMTAA